MFCFTVPGLWHYVSMPCALGLAFIVDQALTFVSSASDAFAAASVGVWLKQVTFWRCYYHYVAPLSPIAILKRHSSAATKQRATTILRTTSVILRAKNSEITVIRANYGSTRTAHGQMLSPSLKAGPDTLAPSIRTHMWFLGPAVVANLNVAYNSCTQKYVSASRPQIRNKLAGSFRHQSPRFA